MHLISTNIHCTKNMRIIRLSTSKIYTFIVVMIMKILPSCSEIYNEWWFSARNPDGTGDHYAQWNKWSTETALILVNKFLSPLIQCPGACLRSPGAESMMSAPCSEGGIEMKPVWPVVGSVYLQVAPCLCDVSDYRLNGENESKSKDKLLSWPEPQRFLMQPSTHTNICKCPQDWRTQCC
jgi:hypothetical protein